MKKLNEFSVKVKTICTCFTFYELFGIKPSVVELFKKYETFT